MINSAQDLDTAMRGAVMGTKIPGVKEKMTISIEGSLHATQQQPIHEQKVIKDQPIARMLGENEAIPIGAAVDDVVCIEETPVSSEQAQSHDSEGAANANEVVTEYPNDGKAPSAPRKTHEPSVDKASKDDDAIFSIATVDSDQCTKPMSSLGSLFGIGTSTRVAQPIPLGSSPLEVEEGDCVVEHTDATPDEGNNDSSIELKTSRDANDVKENIAARTAPPPTRKKSVKFASMSNVRQFDGDCAVSTLLLQQKEGQEEVRNGPGKVVKRRRRALQTRLDNAVQGNDDQNSTNKDESCIKQDPSTGIFSSPTITLYNENHNPTQQSTKNKRIQVALLHSPSHTQIIHQAMQYIHQDRDILLESLLKWCGIFHGARTGGALSSFLTILPPKIGTRKLLEAFHNGDYLDLLQFPPMANDSIDASSFENADIGDKDSGVCMNDDNNLSNCNCPSDFMKIEGPWQEQSDVSVDDGTHIDPLEKQMPLSYDESDLQLPSDAILSKYGLEDDCPYPTSVEEHGLLWKYCLAISGASWHAASLLTANDHGKETTDVAMHWGGGRHHAHASRAGGFCYVSDVVLAIHRLLHGHSQTIDDDMLEEHNNDSISPAIQRNLSLRRVLYIDVDIHHADAVQAAFYSTDRVLTASFHRHSPGFFPASSGSINEKGEVGTSGLGYNLNVPLPAGIGNVQFLQIYRKALFGLVEAYDPHAIVLCVGADGLEGDELVSGSLGGDEVTGDGWTLSPEGLAECVRITAALCAGWNQNEIICAPLTEKEEEEKKLSSDDNDKENGSCADNPKKETPQRGRRRKLLILGGGGYTPAQTARTYLLCTAAACEGARAGTLWSDLPRDIPSHDYFPRYGPDFELVSSEKKTQIFESYSSCSSIPSLPSSFKDGEEICGEGGIKEEEAHHELLLVDVNQQEILRESNRAIELTSLYIDRQRTKNASPKNRFQFDAAMERDEEIMLDFDSQPKKKKRANGRGGRRKKKKTEVGASQHGETRPLAQKRDNL